MRVDQASTRVTALAYDADAMRARTLFLPFLLLLDGVACKDDEPTGNEFGEPCGYDLETDEEMTCADGLACNIGYCDQTCNQASDCEPVAGYERDCSANVCRIVCESQTRTCPQSLGTPLTCTQIWCDAS